MYLIGIQQNYSKIRSPSAEECRVNKFNTLFFEKYLTSTKQVCFRKILLWHIYETEKKEYLVHVKYQSGVHRLADVPKVRFAIHICGMREKFKTRKHFKKNGRS